MNLTEVAASSAFAGLQNIGSVSASTTVSGSINAGTGSILQFSFLLEFPSNQVISCVRFQAPSNSGQLPNYWYPISSYLQLYDFADGYYIYVTVVSHPRGRQVNVSLVNHLNNTAILVPNFTYNAVAELYTFPF